MATPLELALLLLILRSAGGQQQLSTCDSNLCICSSATRRVDCTPNPQFSGRDFQFTFIPQDLPENTQILIMTGNNLSTLIPDSFSIYQSLETLDLSNNLFTTVPSESLANLSITSLILDNNPLTQIEATAFEAVTTLQTLSIRRIPTLEGLQALQGLNNLRTLQLDDNLLENLPVDFLSTTPQLTTLSLRNNSLQTLPDGFLSPVALTQIDLSVNPWSCDCNLRWLRMYLDTNAILADAAETVCHWPPQHNNPRMQIINVPASGYQCNPPSITEHPTNVSILSNLTLVIPCGLNGAPFPDVVWLKDGEEVNLTSRVSIQRYDAALRFENQSVEDSGHYQCILSNSEGSTSSDIAAIVVLEATCFDTVFTAAHETDIDCGGPFCVSCNLTQNCLLDRDCTDDLVCLYSHILPNSLHYISPTHADAYTCSDPDIPGDLLEAILSTQLPLDLAATLVGDVNSDTLHSSVHDYLATLLETPRSVISNVRLTSVEKGERPLIQIWFDLPTNAQGQEGKSNILSLIDSGSLKATIRVKDEDGFIRCRFNL